MFFFFSVGEWRLEMEMEIDSGISKRLMTVGIGTVLYCTDSGSIPIWWRR